MRAMWRSLVTVCALHVAAAKQPDAHYRYVVVGAGPAGLQLAHYLDSAGRNYIVLEQNNASDVQRWGSFGPTPARQKYNSGTDISDLQLKFDDFGLLSEPSHSALGHDREGAVLSPPALTPCIGLPAAAWRTQASEGKDVPELPLCYRSDLSSSDMRYVSTAAPSRMRVGGGWTGAYHPQAAEVQEYYNYWASEEAPRGVVSHPQPEPARPATPTPAPPKKGRRESVFDEWEEDEADSPPATGQGEEDLATHVAEPTPTPAPTPVVLKRRTLRQQRPLHVRYGSKVVRVSRPLGYNSTLWSTPSHMAQEEAAVALVQGTPRFKLTTSDGQVITCTHLIWAGGLARDLPPYGLNVSAALGEGVAHSYATAPRDGKEYEGKAVLVLGTGPQAQEVASFAVQYASTVHMVGQPVGRLPLQHELPMGTPPAYPHAQVGTVHMGVHGQFLEAALQYTEDAWLAEGLGSRALVMRVNPGSGRVHVTEPVHGCVPDVYGRQEVDCLWKREYDMVIVVSGRAWDDRPFKAGGVYIRGAGQDRGGQDGAGNSTWPAVTGEYASAGTPGLYFAGRLAIGEAMSGPIGSAAAVRYAARALHRVLEEVEQEAYAWAALLSSQMGVDAQGEAQRDGADGRGSRDPLRVDTTALRDGGSPPPAPASVAGLDGVIPAASWPHRRQCGMRQVVDTLLHRMSLASGLYNMPGALADVLLLPPLDPSQQALRDYQGVTSIMTPLEEPWSYRRYTCESGGGGGPGGKEAPMDDTDSTGYPPYALWFPPWQAPPWAHPDAKEEHPAVVAHVKVENSTHRVVDQGVSGWLLEEVPVGAVARKAWEWTVQALVEEGRHKEAADVAAARDIMLSTPSHAPLSLPLAHAPEYVTLTLEAGSGDGYPVAGPAGWKQELLERTGNGTLDPGTRQAVEAEAGRDPLSAARHNASASFPWQSVARHPVLRYYHAALAPRLGGSGSKARPVVVRNARGEVSNIWPLVNGTGGTADYDDQGALLRDGNRTQANGTEAVKLHPAPYSGPLGPPVWECHMKSDPHGDYTSHVGTVLPLARCLLALAARRVDVARHLLKHVPELYYKPRKAKNATSATNSGPAEPLAERAYRLTAGLWTLPMEIEGAQGVPPPGPHAAEIAQVMALPRAVMWFNGHRIQGGRDWWLRMTAAGLARMSGAPLLVLHVLDPWPAEYSNREKAFTAAVAQVTHAAGVYERMLGAPRTGAWPKEAILQPGSNGSDPWAWRHASSEWVTNRSTLPSWTPELGAPYWHVAQAAQTTLAAQPPDPFMSREEVRDAAAEESTREIGYARLTRGAPGAVLISVNARNGRERVWAETLRPPLAGIPAFRIYDWRGARMDLPGTMAPGAAGPGAASVSSGFEAVQQAVSQALQALQEGKTVPAKTVQEAMKEQAEKAKKKSSAASK